MSIFRHKVASSEKLRLAFVTLWRENPQKFWAPSPYCGSSDDEEDAISFRGAENTAGEPGCMLGGGHLWDINRYHKQLEYAAKYLNMQTNGKDKVLVVNLGPSNPSDSLLRTLFDNHVVDLPEAYHEMPPGTGVLPLDVLFSLCSCIKSWLELSEENVVLLHLRSSTGSGMETLKFVKFCFLAYNGNNEDANDQYSSFMEKSAKVLPGSHLSITGTGGPSQQRYSRYFLNILYSRDPPEQQQKVLIIKKISFDGINTVRRARNARVLEHLLFYEPYLVVYERGVEQWKGQSSKKDTTVEFDVGATVTGDVVIGLWFIRNVLIQGQSPTVAFAFHSQFMSPGEFTYSSGRLDLNNDAVAGDLTLRIMFEESTSPVENGVEGPSVGTNIHEMRQIWQDQQDVARRAVCTDPSVLSTQPGEDKFSQLPLNLLPPQSLVSERSTNQFCSVGDENCADRTTSNSRNHPRSGSIEMIEIGVGCSLGSSDSCSKDGVAEREETSVGHEIAPVGEEEAPSTPSMAEMSPICRGFTDQQCVAGPSPSCAVSDSEKTMERTGKRRTGQPPPPPPPPPGRLRGSKTSIPPPPPLSNKVSSERTMVRSRSFYWTKTPKQSGTIWCELTNNDHLPEAISEKLYTMFGPNEGRSSPSPGNRPQRAPSPEMTRTRGVKVVSTGRATNVSITMNRFKAFDGGLEGLFKAVLSGKGLLAEDFKLLSQIAPREDEIRAFNDYGGETHELSTAEQTLMQMCEIPRLKQKAHCWVMIDNWETNYDKATNMLHVTKAACQEIKDSRKLRSVFEVVLTVGNSMNKGTHRGNAGGCRVDSLLKLIDTKVTGYSSSDPRRNNSAMSKLPSSDSPPPGFLAEDEIYSLLDFVAMVVLEQYEDYAQISVDSFLLLDLQSLLEADNYLDGSVEELLDEVREGFEAIELEIEAALGKKWSMLQSLSHEDIEKMATRGEGKYAKEETEFILALFDFLQGTMETRGKLRQEHSVCEQFLKSAATWLGEPETVNPRRVLRDLFQFAKVFDDSFRRIAPFIEGNS